MDTCILPRIKYKQFSQYWNRSLVHTQLVGRNIWDKHSLTDKCTKCEASAMRSNLRCKQQVQDNMKLIQQLMYTLSDK